MNSITRLLPVSGLCLCAFTLNAQISIGAADMPAAGDTLRFSNSTTTADMGDTGPAHTWDFSGLVPGAEGADTMVTVGSTPVLYQFFFNNGLLYPAYHANFAMRGASIGLQGFSIDQVFDYYKTDASGHRDVGFGAMINSLPTSVQRTPVDWIYRFPMDFGNTDSSASAFNIAVPTLGYYGQSQVRHNEVDGWGTLYLPTDTFQVLRVMSHIDRTDTIHIDQFGFGFSIPEPETVEYKWLAQGMGRPVLQVTTVGGVPTTVEFHYHPVDITTGLGEQAGQGVSRVWPDPTSGTLNITDAPKGLMEIFAADGREIRAIDLRAGGAQAIDVSDLVPGVYLLRYPASGRSVRFAIVK